MKIVVLDGYTENPGDLSWNSIRKFGEVEIYDRTAYEDSPLIVERIGDAEIVIVNKTPITKDTINKCQNIKLIAVLATGYNVIDYEYAKEKRNHGSKCSDIWNADRWAVCSWAFDGNLFPLWISCRNCKEWKMGQ